MRKSSVPMLVLTVLLLSNPGAEWAGDCGGAFVAIADASTFEAAPTQNFGSDGDLRIEDPGDGMLKWRTHLRFDTSGALPPGAIVDAAFLRLRAIGADGELPWEIEVRGADKAWGESVIDWERQPVASAPYAGRGSDVVDGVLAVDVTELVTHWARGEREDPTIVLTSGKPGAVVFLSREAAAADEAPELTILCHLPSPLDPLDPTAGDAAQIETLGRLRADSLERVRQRLVRGAVASAHFRVVVPASDRRDSLARARWFLREYEGLLRAGNADAAWQLRARSPDGKHLRFRQRHQGIPVTGAEVIVHLEGEDVTGLSGAYTADLPTLQAPTIPLERAVALALVQAGEGSARGGDVRQAIFDPRLAGSVAATEPRLVWEVPVEGPRGGIYLIDALDGATLHVETGVQEAFDLALDTAGSEQGPIAPGCWFWNSGNVQWFNEFGQTRFSPPTPDAEGFGAFDHIGAVDRYWRAIFGRDGHDNHGGEEGLYLDTIILGRNNTPTNNAQYHGFCNDFRFTDNMATLDIIGHEYTHGVVRNEAGLWYSNQSGALNESYADLFGHAVDPGDWTIGEGSTVGPIRDLSDPPSRNCFLDDQAPSLFPCPDHMSGFRISSADNGGVHTNSNIMNKAGYLLIAGGSHGGYTIAALGRAKTERLLYDTLTNRLGSFSAFIDQRDQMMAAAAADPTVTASEVCQVRNAYAAVGVGQGDADCDDLDDSFEVDDDADGVLDTNDNCPRSANGSQADMDNDGQGDACDPDIDGDGRSNVSDNCPRVLNPGQLDWNSNGIGDSCEDFDGDGVRDSVDNCRTTHNPDQRNSDYDLAGGDACDPDDDDDGTEDTSDNCPMSYNPAQADLDKDGRGDFCDNCRDVPNPDQLDTDRDGNGNDCDDDWDNDGVLNVDDNCPYKANPTQTDWDGDGRGNACDGLETQIIHEDPTFFLLERYAQWPIFENVPLEIGVPICPVCQGEALSEGFLAELQVQMHVPFRAVVRDSTGRAVEVAREPQLEQVLRFRPEPNAFSRFLPPQLAVIGTGSDPDYLAADQTRYFLELYPADPTDRGVDQGVLIGHLQCVDSDGDGYGLEGSDNCPAGPQIDCDDADWYSSPGGAERCDGRDNDCDTLVDDNPLPPARTARLFVGPGGDVRWTELDDTWGYDLVRGSIARLRDGGGDFSAADTVCVAAGTDERSFLDGDLPDPRDVAFYLVRGRNCAGSGSWDLEGPGQQDSRDPGLMVCGP